MTPAWRAVLRIAVRDARRDRGRSLLVLVLVMLPVAGLVAAATIADWSAPTAEERAVATMGRADVALYPADAGVDDATPEALLDELTGRLPAGARVERRHAVSSSIVVDGRWVPLVVDDVSLSPDALAAGTVELLTGDAPAAEDEIALTSALLDELGRELGDRIELEGLGERRIVGEVRDPEWLTKLAAIAPEGGLADHPDAGVTFLVDLPDGAAVAEVLGDDVALDGGWPADVEPRLVGETRDAVLAERFGASERAFLVIVGGLAAVEVALVAGAAFTVSVRRRQRELGLLAATGGRRVDVRRSVLLSGAAVGVAGAGLGTVLGLLLSVALRPLASSIGDRVITSSSVDLTWVLTSAAIGIGAALLGAALPARGVARLPVLTALSGRRPPPARSTRGLVFGVLLVVAGTGLGVAGAWLGAVATVAFLVGAVAVVLGAGLASPWLLEQLGRTARFLPVGPRLAVRDAARFRTRTGPIVTAAMAGLAASVTVGAITGSLAAAEERAYEPQLPADVILVESSGVAGAADTVAAATGLRAAPLRRMVVDVLVGGTATGGDSVPDGSYLRAAIVDPTLVADLVGDTAAADLESGRAVALAPVPADTVDLSERDEVTGLPAEVPVSLELVPIADSEVDGAGWGMPQVLLPATPEVLELADPDEPSEHLLVADGPVDDELLDVASRAAAELGDGVAVLAERGYRSTYANIALGFTLVGGLAGTLIVVVAIALAAAESRGDLRTLSAVGAERRTRRSLAAGRALLLAGLGGVLAVPVGLLPAWSLLRIVDGGTPLVLPWPTIAVVTLLVPLVVTLGAMVASSREPRGLTRAA